MDNKQSSRTQGQRPHSPSTTAQKNYETLPLHIVQSMKNCLDEVTSENTKQAFSSAHVTKAKTNLDLFHYTKKARLGLALSGGGIRAAIFHLGVLQFLAQANIFDDIASISTVSGASLAIGIVLATNNNKWPCGNDYKTSIQTKIRDTILQNNIQSASLRRLPFYPKYWRHRVGMLAKMLETKWGISGTLQDIPTAPYWEINCTTFETGNNFRLRRDYMGDEKIGYVQNPQMPLSHAIAASAAFPILIGPYILDTSNLIFTPDKHGQLPFIKTDAHYSLWDGGVYDNLGLDALYKTGRGMDPDIDFMVVSNASASIKHQPRKGTISLHNLYRLLEISQNQVDLLRTRQVLANVVRDGKGIYLKIGYTAEKLAEKLGIVIDNSLLTSSLSTTDVNKVRDYPTTLNSPTPSDYDLIFKHGYENAKCAFDFQTMLKNKIEIQRMDTQG